MEKVIRDDRVAVIVSPGYGAGWYTWHNIEELLYDPSIVEWIEQGALDKIAVYMELRYPDVYLSQSREFKIKWVPVGERFRITEYDGSESLVLESEQQWLTA